VEKAEKVVRRRKGDAHQNLFQRAIADWGERWRGGEKNDFEETHLNEGHRIVTLETLNIIYI
jgi:hypothetical protein